MPCAQLSQAGKRLSPSDPDRSRAPAASLPFWDMLRFVWRGQIGFTARWVPVSMPSASSHIHPLVQACSPLHAHVPGSGTAAVNPWKAFAFPSHAGPLFLLAVPFRMLFKVASMRGICNPDIVSLCHLIRRFEFCMAKTPTPDFGASSERLQARAVPCSGPRHFCRSIT